MEAGPSSSYDPLQSVDDFYFSALHDNEEIFPISDEKYAEEFQFQEALISSALISSQITESSSSLQMMRQHPHDMTLINKTVKGKEKESSEEGQFCQPIFCLICMDLKSKEEMFNDINGCNHSFCNECIRNYLATKIQQNIVMIKCPDPKCISGMLEPNSCRSIVPQQVFDRWENALCESTVIDSQKFYCPFKDCSVMLIDDGGESVTVSECPDCHRLFCAKCKVAWHSGIDCEEFQKLNENDRKSDDIIFIELVKKKQWRRCPQCEFYVEKTEGCLHITCRYFFLFFNILVRWFVYDTGSKAIMDPGFALFTGVDVSFATAVDPYTRVIIHVKELELDFNYRKNVIQ